MSWVEVAVAVEATAVVDLEGLTLQEDFLVGEDHQEGHLAVEDLLKDLLAVADQRVEFLVAVHRQEGFTLLHPEIIITPPIILIFLAGEVHVIVNHTIVPHMNVNQIFVNHVFASHVIVNHDVQANTHSV